MNLFSRFFGRRRPRTIRKSSPQTLQVRPQIEILEDRFAPAVLPVDATHTFVSQLQAAQQGDTIQINTGGTIGTLGGAGTGSGTVGSTTFTASTPIVAGQLIDITGEGGNPYLVDASTGSGPYTLTLHTPLTATTAGATYTPVANTLGIGKGITILGNTANPPSALFAGTTLEYFLQLPTVTPAPDTLQNLSLTAVSGVTSSDLSIVSDKFNVSSGSIDPIDVTSGGALNINSDTFTIGGTATLASVVVGSTGAGAISYASDTVNVTGNLTSAAVSLTSTSGPLTLSNDSLTVTGNVGDDGFSLSANNAISLSSVTENITGTVFDTGIDIDTVGNLTLSNISVNLGSTAGYGIYAANGGNVVMSGTNSVTITGAVSTAGVYFTGSANVTVSNLTINLKSNTSEGLYISESGNISLSNANVTIVGNSTSSDGAIYLSASGSIALANITLLVQGNAEFGLYAYDYGNMTVSGTESFTVNGNVAGATSSAGVYLYTSYGNVTVSTPLSVTVGGTAVYGLYEYATGNLTNSGAVTVNVKGAVSSYGAFIESEATSTVAAITVTLGSTADYGLYVYGYTTNINGAINVSVTGAVSSYGAYIESYYGNLTITSPITVSLAAAAAYGLELYAYETNLIDTATGTSPTITVSVAGDVTGTYGAIYIYANSLVSIAGAAKVTVGGAATYGLYMESDEYNVIDTAGINVSITGAVADEGVYVFATQSATLSNIVMTLADVASGEGLYVSVYYGTMTVTNVTVTANMGTTSAYGVDLYSDEYGGTIVAANIIVNMNLNADYGLYAYTSAGSITLSNTAVSVTGDVSKYGIYAQSEYGGNITLSGNTTLTIGGTADYGMYIYADESSVLINGPLSATVTGAVTNAGIYVYAATNINSTASIAVNLGSDTSSEGLELYADEGDVTDTGTITVNVMGNVSDTADYIYANNLISLSGATKVTVGGTADYGAYIESDEGSVIDTVGITVSITGAVADDGAYVFGTQSATLSNIVVTLADVASAQGLYVYTDYGAINVSNVTVTANGGTTSANGVDLYSEYGGSIIGANIIVNMNADADYGLYAYAEEYGGSISLSSTAVSVKGDVNSYGIYAYSSYGNVTLSGNTTVTIGGTADYGMEIDADEGSVTISGPLSVTVTGAVSSYGMYVYAASSITSTASISVNLVTSTDFGIELYADEGNVTDTGTITESVGGNVTGTDGGLYIYANNLVSLSGATKVTVGGTANYGAYIESDESSVIDTVGITVSITGAVADEGVYVYADQNITVSNVVVTLADVASGEGLYLYAYYGNINASNLTVTANGGTSSAYGIDLYTVYQGSITAANIIVNMNAQAAYGLYAYTEDGGNISLSSTAISIAGNVADEGIYDYADYGSIALSGNTTVNLGGTADYGMYLYADEGTATISGPLSASVTGAVTGDTSSAGIYLYAASAIASTASISVNLGSTADYGLYVDASDGDFTDTGTITVTVASDVTYYGAYLYSAANERLGGNVNVTLGGIAEFGLYVEASEGALSNGGTIAVTVTGAVSYEGAYLYASAGATLANISVNLKSTLGNAGNSDGWGADIESYYGNLTVSNLTVQVSGAITDSSGTGGGLYLYSDTANVISSNVNVSLLSTAGYGIYADATYGNLTMTATTLSVVGDVVDYGAYLYAGSSATISNLNESLQGTSGISSSEGGLYIEGYYGGVTASGILFQEAGATFDAVYLYGYYGNVAGSNINIYLGSTAADDGFYAIANYGDLNVSAVSLQAAGLISNDGLELDCQGDLTAFNNSIVLNAGVTVDALYTDSDYDSSPGGSTTILNNRIVSQVTTGNAGIEVVGTGSLTMTHNTVFLNGGTATGALLSDTSGNLLTIKNNSFNTAGAGTGLAFSGGAPVVALVQGNDFHNNKIGIQITGDRIDAGNIDMGGGTLGSLGGNDFHGFTGAAGTYPISLLNTSAVSTVFALNNIWSVANPATIVQDAANGGGTGIINVGAVQLTAFQQFVDATYNQFLGRSAPVAQLNLWVGYSQAAVVQGIQFSAEGINYLLNNLYIEFLNRNADPGASGWLPSLQSGHEEQVIDGLVSSAEFAAKNPYTVTSNNSNSGYVQALYSVLLNRSFATGNLTQAEINAWVSALAGGQSRNSVAASFTAGTEFRTDVVRSMYGDPTLSLLPFLQVVPNLLHRTTAPGTQVNGWVNSSLLMMGIESAIAGSPEYYANC